MAHEHASHEGSDINFRAILGFGAGLIVFAVVIHVLVWGLFRFFASGEAGLAAPSYPKPTAQTERLPMEPRLQTHPRQDLRDLRANEDRILNSYAWVDRPAGTVRIPIAEAMKLVVERGLPVRAESK